MNRLSRRLDRFTLGFLGLVVIAGIVYTSFELTPSSYGGVLARFGAAEYGPVWGEARLIRSDEWSLTTPFFQAAVRNGFRRMNETSFYKEDLRGQSTPLGLPLEDWGLIFKPQLWAFFLASPGIAYSAYWAILMCSCLAGYQLLFCRLGMDSALAAAIAVMIFFSGFAQFWWTTYAPLIVCFPWILLVSFSQLRWWRKALWFSWVLPVWAMGNLYPPLLVDLSFAAMVVILAFEPSWLRRPKELAAAAIGGLMMLLVIYAYYADIIPIMRNTEYPGHRVAGPGGATRTSVLSQFFPYLSFTLGGYGNLKGSNICESGAVGSFLPLLTLCLARYRDLWSNRIVRRALVVLLAALALVTLWEIAPAPHWIGRILLWDRGPATRLLLISGLLLTFASVLVWSSKLISVHPVRILVFVLVGPVASAVLKLGVYHVPLAASTGDLVLCVFAAAAALVAFYVPGGSRALVLFSAITLINVYAFGRFNPLQPAGPIFQIPETDAVRQLRAAQDASPEHILIDHYLIGATMNGMGFRSVSHGLITPTLPVLRRYFPSMDAQQFNKVFNRFSNIMVTDDRLPTSPFSNLVRVPREAFEPVRNVRTLTIESASRKDCSAQRGGAIDRAVAEGDHLTIEGWAPWQGEDRTQELHVLSTRQLHAGPLVTIKRPDVSETMKDYGYTRSGFRVVVSSVDGRPLRGDEVVLVARNTTQGLAQLVGCGCE